MLMVDRVFLDYLRSAFPEAQRERILNAVYLNGTLQEVEEVPEQTRKIFKTALEINPQWHLKTQAAFQKYVDNAVSKTVNLPQSATEADVAAIFREAHALGLKGLTLYRMGSRKEQPLTPLISCPPCHED
jgi:ribonucleoside-diphosphate reductase alpha chain